MGGGGWRAAGAGGAGPQPTAPGALSGAGGAGRWQKLRLSNDEQERLAWMAEGWRSISPGAGEQAARALIYRLKPEKFTDTALLAWARSPASAHDAPWRKLATLPRYWTAPAFPLKAADFIGRGGGRGR